MSPPWRRRILIGILVLAVLLAIPVGREYYARWDARGELDEVIARLDAAEPGWRLDDIEAARRVVPDAANGARVVTAAHRLLPEQWGGAIADEVEKLPPPVALRDDQAAALAAELRRLEPALRQARELKDRPHGRFPITYTPDFISTLIPGQMNTRPVARLLDLDGTDAAHREEPTRAWAANRALLNAGRSLGDEPLLISMLVRMAIDTIAVRNLERTLAQGELSPAQLAERQRALADESAEPRFLVGIRGERAGNDRLCTNLESGTLRLMPFLEQAGSGRAAQAGWWDVVPEFLSFSMVLRSHTTLLRHETEMVEAARLPPAQRYRALADIRAAIPDVPSKEFNQTLAQLLLPAVLKIAEAEQRVQTHLDCAVVGVAAERFRLARGRWPAAADELVRAGLLPAVPLDRFEGQPLRWRAAPDGVVVYAVGKEGSYDGTALDDLTDFNPDAIRTEFRLWDPAHRRQPPPPPADLP